MPPKPALSWPIRAELICTFLAVMLLLAACSSSGDTTPVTTEDASTAAETAETAPAEPDPTATVAPDEAEDPDEAEADEDHDDDHSHDTDEHDTDDHEDDDHEHAEPVASASGGVNLDLFFDGAISESEIVDCTLSGGAETTCYRITAAGYPTSYEVGPFCPSTITDEVGGLWWDGNELYDLNGEFIANLAEIYADDNWQMFDADGNVLITETAEEFDLAARPNVDPSLQNHCVEGRLEWLDGGEPVTTTVLIPTEPVAAASASAPRGNQGLTLDGIVIANAAPVDAILGAYTVAAFDDCGAHFNPVDGYHLHGAVGCSELGEASDGETPMFGYALDGYPVHSPLEDTSGLDECNGHTTEEAGYHYHANSAEQNQVIECLMGQTSTGTTGDNAAAGQDEGPGDQGERGAPDFSEAAAALGVSTADLEAALGQPPFDLDASAATLGISAADLEAALPAPPAGGRPGG